MDLLGSQRRMLEQAFTQVSEVSVRVSRGGDAFVHLDHMHALPWHILTGEGTQHLPRRVTAADGHNKTTALRNGCPGVRRDNFGSLLRHCAGIGKYLNLHR